MTKAHPSEPHTGLQGESGCWPQSRARRRRSSWSSGSMSTQSQITQWKDQLLEGAAGVFRTWQVEAVPAPVDLKALHAKIQGWRWRTILEGALTKAGLLSAKR